MTTPPNNGGPDFPEYPNQNPSDGNSRANNGGNSGDGFSHYPQYPSTPHPEDAPGYNAGGSQGYDPTQGYPSYGAAGGAGAQQGSYPQPGSGNQLNDGLNPNMVNTDGGINVMRAVKWGVGTTFSNAGVFIGGAFLTGLVIIALAAVNAMLSMGNQQSLVYNILDLAISLVSAAWMIFVIRLTIWQVDKVKAKFSDLFNNVHFWPGFIVSLLLSLITGLIIMIPTVGWVGSKATKLANIDDPVAMEKFIVNDLGSLLAIIGVVSLILLFIYPLLMFPTEFATEGRAGIGGAFAQAFQVGKSNYGRLLAYNVVVGIVGGLIVTLTLGLGALIVIPAGMLIKAHLYRQGAGGPIPHDAEYDGPVQGYGDNYNYGGYHGFA
ncbi:hypothetical protein [Corynebacterium cystitidis]|uniref:hypothetical protein n=1 Tax=Corynebacterium cystitidis TaxID=35757 RepID=UPI00211EDE75|nr:hypothetical protein [Corynebacterium cystitidis]